MTWRACKRSHDPASRDKRVYWTVRRAGGEALPSQGARIGSWIPTGWWQHRRGDKVIGRYPSRLVAAPANDQVIGRYKYKLLYWGS